MPRTEHIGVDPVWQRVVLPSTACLRLGILLALGFARVFHLEVALPVLVVAGVMGLVYAAAYLAVWRGRLSSEYLGYGAILDCFLLGALLGGSGAHAPLIGFLGLLGLSLAHMCGGVRLSLAALGALAAGWLGVQGLGVTDLVRSEAWTWADFGLALETEPTYGGRAISALSEHQIVRAALASLFLISLSGCLAFARAQWERRKVAQACAEVEALEAIVDCFTGNASDTELWETVCRSASQVSGARVFSAVADDELVRVEGTSEGAADDVLHGLRVPLSASDNLIVQGIVSGREAETENLADLLHGSDGAPAGVHPRRRAHYVIVPVTRQSGGAALIAVVHGNAAAAVESLRLVAERTELVLRARESFRSRFDLEPAPAGA